MQQLLKMWMKLPIHQLLITLKLFHFLSQLQVLNVSTCVFIFCTNYKDMSKKMSDSIISPSDGDTSEEEEFTKIMPTNNATVVENVDETSNSSTSDYTEAVSLSLTTSSTERKYMCIHFLHQLQRHEQKNV